MQKVDSKLYELQHIAERLMSMGRVAEAIRAYRDLVAQFPDSGNDWFNLGYLLRVDRQYGDATSCYRRALACGAERPEDIHLNLAVILSEFLNDSDGAIRELKLALTKNPNFMPALLSLAHVYEDLGLFSEAIEIYEKAISVDPACGRALGRRAILQRDHGESELPILTLRSAIESARSPGDIAELSFALGHLLDANGQFDAAFHSFEVANKAVQDEFEGAFRYDTVGQHAFIDRIIKQFGASHAAVIGEERQSPIFICGMFRSGSTLVEQILARHSLISAGGEREFIPATISGIQNYPEGVAAFGPDDLARVAGEYDAETRRLFPNGKIVTDKRPDNFLHIGFIKRLFPGARFVHTVRNPLDNILSIFFGNFDPSVTYATSIVDAADWHVNYQRLMAHWKSAFPGDILDLNYDELVQNPDREVEQVLAFLDLGFEHLSQKPADDVVSVRTLSNWQVRQPLHSKSSGRWRNYERHLSAAVERLERA